MCEWLVIPVSLMTEVGLMQNCAAVISDHGYSMEPTLSYSYRPLVDIREQQPAVLKGFYEVVSDKPECDTFEIDHSNGRNFKIIGKALVPLFKKDL